MIPSSVILLASTSTLFLTVSAIPAYGAPAWSSLNKTLSNRLQTATPFALPCFSNYNGKPVASQPGACAEVQANYASTSYRVDHFSSYMNSQDEICSPDPSSQCLLDPNSLSTQTNSSAQCNQGAVPPYYIEVQTADDIKAAFSFASSTNTPLAIKNSGHDYNGRSSGPGSLALWTRKLQKLEYHASFTPAGCSRPTGSAAITTGAGVVFDQVYQFADQHNATFVGGSGPTVGVSGGWVMTGGHGILSPSLGLGVDRVLEFEIVTPDGAHRFVNSCQDPDLFWALRGGGGGTFGVVLSTTHRVEPALVLSVATIALPATASADVQGGFLDLIISNSLNMSSQGWGGIQLSNQVLLATPLLNLADAQSSLAPLVAYAQANGGVANIESLPTWYAFYSKYIAPAAQPAGSVAFSNNRLITTDILASASGRQSVRAYMDWLRSQSLTPIILSTTPYLYSGNGKDEKVQPYGYGTADVTSAVPGWRKSAFMITTQTGWAYNALLSDRKKVVSLLKEVSARAEALSPNGGAYGNEAQPWTQNWQKEFWGANYARLTQLKRKWDPKGLLACYHCVGGSDAAVIGGKCLGSLGN